MKYLFIFLFFLASMTMSAQKFTVRKTADVESLALNDSVARTHIFEAGDGLERSAKLQNWAIGLSVLSGMTLYAANKIEEKNGDKGVPTLLTVAALGGVTAAICELFSIQWKLTAGRELKIGAGELIYRF